MQESFDIAGVRRLALGAAAASLRPGFAAAVVGGRAAPTVHSLRMDVQEGQQCGQWRLEGAVEGEELAGNLLARYTKKSRWTNHAAPTSATASEAVRTRRGSQIEPRIQMSGGTKTSTTSAWPASTPRLKPRSAIARFQGGSASGVSAEAKPKPWTRPKRKLTSQRCDGTSRRIRFSVATQTMDTAITGSTRRSGRTTTWSTASASVTL